MISLRTEHALHTSYLHRLLIECIDQPILAKSLAFKGGTCAAMLGYLDRFSVDLDFDIISDIDDVKLHDIFLEIFTHMELKVLMDNKKTFQCVVQYKASTRERSNIKISALRNQVKNNRYTAQNLSEIDRIMTCQTLDTMVANKLVAPLDRFAKHTTIAGRDIYDIHHFLLHQYPCNFSVIQERTKMNKQAFITTLLEFLQTHITQRTIDEDINMLLPLKRFTQIRKILIPETMRLLKEMHRG